MYEVYWRNWSTKYGGLIAEAETLEEAKAAVLEHGTWRRHSPGLWCFDLENGRYFILEPPPKQEISNE